MRDHLSFCHCFDRLLLRLIDIFTIFQLNLQRTEPNGCKRKLNTLPIILISIKSIIIKPDGDK